MRYAVVLAHIGTSYYPPITCHHPISFYQAILEELGGRRIAFGVFCFSFCIVLGFFFFCFVLFCFFQYTLKEESQNVQNNDEIQNVDSSGPSDPVRGVAESSSRAG